MSPEEATFARRGFSSGDGVARDRLERIGKTFLRGYNTSLERSRAEGLTHELNEVDLEYRGFAFEGAAMGLGLQDFVLRWRRDRWRRFLEGPGANHAYMVHVGLGWVWARLGRPVERYLSGLDPLLGWLAIDGYGFHEGYFKWRHYVESQALPRKLSGYALSVFDQGVGRSLWFVRGADVERVINTVCGFDATRHRDLWSGVGLACAYAGGAAEADMAELRRAADAHWPALAQGAAFAAKARQRAGNPADHTDLAARVLCETTADEAAAATDAALDGLSHDSEEPAYETWRKRVQASFARETVRL